MNGEEGRVCRGHASLNIGVNKHPLIKHLLKKSDN